MIKVIYYRNYHRVTVEGHALSGEPGHDLVCASASILTYTLATNVLNMRDNGQVRDTFTAMDDGKAEVSCTPRHNLRNSVTLIYDSICAGFELLAHQYPDNISYEIHA